MSEPWKEESQSFERNQFAQTLGDAIEDAFRKMIKAGNVSLSKRKSPRKPELDADFPERKPKKP